jgi:hypothetical protein
LNAEDPLGDDDAGWQLVQECDASPACANAPFTWQEALAIVVNGVDLFGPDETGFGDVIDAGVDDYASESTSGDELANDAGTDFSQADKQVVWNNNAADHDGANVCDNCGKDVVKPSQSQKGVTPPNYEGQVDHVFPKALGGKGEPENGQILCRTCNVLKGKRFPWP